MSGFTGSRKRVLVWAFVKFLLTVCDWQGDAPAAISLDQPLTLSELQPTHAAVNDHLR
jgi:hypothetical protein